MGFFEKIGNEIVKFGEAVVELEREKVTKALIRRGVINYNEEVSDKMVAIYKAGKRDGAEAERLSQQRIQRQRQQR